MMRPAPVAAMVMTRAVGAPNNINTVATAKVKKPQKVGLAKQPWNCQRINPRIFISTPFHVKSEIILFAVEIKDIASRSSVSAHLYQLPAPILLALALAPGDDLI
jgi:hypothetical protein